MIDALKKGDKVVTIGGIHGVVSATKEKTVIVKVDDGVKMEFNRSAISGVVVEGKAEPAKSEKKAVTESKDSKEEKSAEASAETSSDSEEAK